MRQRLLLKGLSRGGSPIVPLGYRLGENLIDYIEVPVAPWLTSVDRLVTLLAGRYKRRQILAAESARSVIAMVNLGSPLLHST